MIRYLDPRSDLVFKRIFGEHPEILRSFLNAILPFDHEDEMIISLTYLPSELAPTLPVLKNTIVDVRCQDKAGRQFIVEMQMSWTSAFLQRMLFNASKAYVRQLEKKEQFELLQPVIGLALLDDTFDPGPDYYHHYRVVNVERPERVIEGLQLVFVELPKYHKAYSEDLKGEAHGDGQPVPPKPASNLPAAKSPGLLRRAWLRFLSEAGDAGNVGYPTAEQLREEVGLTPELNEALEMAWEASFTKAELEAYDRFWDSVRVERTLISGKLAEGEKIGLEKGRAEGIEIGEKRGMERGMEIGVKEGIEKGRLEGIQESKRELLANLIKAGMDEAEARRLSGLIEG